MSIAFGHAMFKEIITRTEKFQRKVAVLMENF